MNKTAELVQKFFKNLGEWVTQNNQQYQYVPIPKEQTDAKLANDPLVPERDYFRVTLCEMFLTKSREWFTNQYPAVHSAVFLKFSDREKAAFSNVARPPEEQLAQGVYLNYPVTDLLPYNGGAVEIEMALVALKGSNSLSLAIDVLQDFAGLVAVPLGQALDVADKVTGGIQRLIDSTNGGVHLGAHQMYTPEGGNPLRQGYYAVVMSTDNKLGGKVFVDDDRLLLKDGANTKPLLAYDYLLYKIEGTSNRADWRLSYIDQPLKEAQKAYVLGEANKAEVFRKNALLAALQAPDLTVEDRWTVIDRINAELDRVAGLGRGAQGKELPDLNGLMEAPAAAPVRRKGAPTFEAVFGR